ncbi:MAG: phosphopantothenoylcysteine decarboxylase [Planctomycetota bacterium]|nr:phosphopantothenoylcysteine decarboxylase [Planctomycetota bacterium]
MKIIVTTGPTREYIDSVRFITTASSGKMGYAVAAEAVLSGHEVTLITGPTAIDPPAGCKVVRFVTVRELAQALDERFDDCDALIMAAAVGDFTVEKPAGTKISRSAGPVRITLEPTEDVLAGLCRRKRPGQIIVAFAVEDLPTEQAEAKARDEMQRKNADYVVLNPPAAMGAETSEACILSPDGIVLTWARRAKTDLARQIIALLETK